MTSEEVASKTRDIACKRCSQQVQRLRAVPRMVRAGRSGAAGGPRTRWATVYTPSNYVHHWRGGHSNNNICPDWVTHSSSPSANYQCYKHDELTRDFKKVSKGVKWEMVVRLEVSQLSHFESKISQVLCFGYWRKSNNGLKLVRRVRRVYTQPTTRTLLHAHYYTPVLTTLMRFQR